ncbi:MAG TPA: hypothetical protein VFD58_24610 [Blastocatellia bacterium]|nr:hypothetical protein [Blastocatellia bacterium]
MDASGRQPWLRRALFPGIVYSIVGIVFGTLVNPSVSSQGRFMWRLAAWVISAAVYAAHIGYEHFRMGNPPRSTALHVAVGVAVGAFALAVAAIVHSLWAASGNLRLLMVALVAWPVITALPAFLVALAAAAVLARLTRSA